MEVCPLRVNIKLKTELKIWQKTDVVIEFKIECDFNLVPYNTYINVNLKLSLETGSYNSLILILSWILSLILNSIIPNSDSIILRKKVINKKLRTKNVENFSCPVGFFCCPL